MRRSIIGTRNFLLPVSFERGHLDESLLAGLSEEKRKIIRSFLVFTEKG